MDQKHTADSVINTKLITKWTLQHNIFHYSNYNINPYDIFMIAF